MQTRCPWRVNGPHTWRPGQTINQAHLVIVYSTQHSCEALGGLAPHLVVHVVAQNVDLYVQFTGERAFRFLPLSEWHFFCTSVGVQITFEPGEDGRAARLILHQTALIGLPNKSLPVTTLHRK